MFGSTDIFPNSKLDASAVKLLFDEALIVLFDFFRDDDIVGLDIIINRRSRKKSAENHLKPVVEKYRAAWLILPSLRQTEAEPP